MLKYCIAASFLLVSANAAAKNNNYTPVTNESAQAIISYDWHDGSKGGVYGIGAGWSIELLPAQYGPKTITYTNGEYKDLILIPAEYEWVKEDVSNAGASPEMETVYLMLPAEYGTIKETMLTEEAKVEYYFHEVDFNSEGDVLRRKYILPRKIPEVFGNVTRQAIMKPMSFVERRFPLKRNEGLKRVVKTPAKIIYGDSIGITHTFSGVVQPWRFNIKNPDGKVVHSFDNYKDFKVFERSLY